MYLEFIPILFFVLMTSLIVFMILYNKELKRNKPIKCANALEDIKNKLKLIKKEIDNQGEYNYNIKHSSSILYVFCFIIACGISAYLGYTLFSEGSYKFNDIKGFATSILLVFATLIIVVLRNNIKDIKLDNSVLTIKSRKNTKKYNIHEIEKLKIEIITTHRFRSSTALKKPVLNIKNKNNSEHDSYEIKYNSLNNIIAIMFYIMHIKQNKIDAIDTLTEDEIIKIEKEILI